MIVIAADALHDQQHERLEPGERRSQHLLAVRRMDTKVRVDPECPLALSGVGAPRVTNRCV